MPSCDNFTDKPCGELLTGQIERRLDFEDHFWRGYNRFRDYVNFSFYLLQTHIVKATDAGAPDYHERRTSITSASSWNYDNNIESSWSPS